VYRVRAIPDFAIAGGRLSEIERAKGLAIVLVVFGHLVARDGPRDVTWYEPLRGAVYLFHMPFFFYLSGFVAFRSGAVTIRAAQWSALACRRAARLLVPFLLFGVTIVLAKRALTGLIAVDNVPASTIEGLADLVWSTRHSPAMTVWYLIALFVYCLVTPAIVWLGGVRPVIALAAFVVYLLPAPPVAYLDRICGYWVFFIAGCLAAKAGNGWTSLLDRRCREALAIFLVLLGAAACLGVDSSRRGWMLVVGLASMPAIHGLVRSPPMNMSRTLMFLGRMSFAIYLFNTPCIGLAKGVMLRLLSWDGAGFLLFAPVLLISGLMGPILVKRFIAPKFPALDRLTA